MDIVALISDLLVPLLWLALGIAASVLLAVIALLLRHAVSLIRPCDRWAEPLSTSDTRFLRGMHIRR